MSDRVQKTDLHAENQARSAAKDLWNAFKIGHEQTAWTEEQSFIECVSAGIMSAYERVGTLTVEIEQWKNAARVMAALYGANVHFDGGSWFRDNIEISLDEELPAEDIEELLQVAWAAARDGVTKSLQTKDSQPVCTNSFHAGVNRYVCPDCRKSWRHEESTCNHEWVDVASSKNQQCKLCGLTDVEFLSEKGSD